tara:strand:- start:125 stop:979 length:855 start_codon:yes stop_codon:yes gene_type:complete
MLPFKKGIKTTRKVNMNISPYSHCKSKTSTLLEFIKNSSGVSAIACAVLLTGCGGSSSNDNDSIVRPDSVLGIWFGQATTVEGGQEMVLIAVSPEGKATMFSEASRDTLIAHGSVSENVFSSEDTMLYPGANMTRRGSMQATATEDSLEGSATVSGRILGFSADKVDSSEDVSLTDIAGNYSTSRAEGSYTRSFAIDADGIISGSDSNGCSYSGAVEPISGMSALFNITVKADVCFDDFEYEGLLAYGAFPFEFQNSINERKGIVIAAEDSSNAFAFRQFSPQD